MNSFTLSYRKLGVEISNITVIIPCKNSELFVADAIQSVLAQSLHVSEIVVVDNGSSDKTLSILQSYASKYPQVKVVENSTGGVSKSRNVGIEKSTGEIIGFLDSDDLWDQEKVFKHYQHLANHPNCAFSFSGSIEIDMLHSENRKASGTNPEYSFQRLLTNSFIIHGSASSVFVRKNVLTAVGGFDEKMIFGEDWDLWLKIGKNHQLCDIGSHLVTIRKFAKSTQRTKYRDLNAFHRTFALLTQWNTHLNDLEGWNLSSSFFSTSAFDLVHNWNNPSLWNGGWSRKVLSLAAPDLQKKLGLQKITSNALPIYILYTWLRLRVFKRFRK